jgi:hypothetical protein
MHDREGHAMPQACVVTSSPGASAETRLGLYSPGATTMVGGFWSTEKSVVEIAAAAAAPINWATMKAGT